MKKILVFSNGEKIGDGIIKLPLIYEINKRLPDYKIIWVTNLGTTVYKNQLKNISSQYIYQIIEKANLKPFFWQKISTEYDFNNTYFEYIFDTQKSIYRTIALKRIDCKHFISASANGFFSTKKINIHKKNRNYYLDDLLNLLNLNKFKKRDLNFKIPIPIFLEEKLNNIFFENKKYIGLAPGAGEKNKIWPIEKFIELGKYYLQKKFNIVLYLGPNEINIKQKLVKIFPEAIIPEDLIKGSSNIEIVMGSTKFLSCAIANDSGVSHMLSTNHCFLVKLFGPKNSKKFTPKSKFLKTISSKEYNSEDVSTIPLDRVILEINNLLK